MRDTKTIVRFFTIADYEEEEEWLIHQHKNGWKLTKMTPPCFYYFEKCTPENVIYRLDYKNNTEKDDYYQMYEDYDWEYIGHCLGWLYFRKSSSKVISDTDGELFSDNTSRMDMIDQIIKTRLFPILIAFCCCLLPSLHRSIETPDHFSTVFTTIFSILIILYLYLIIHCGTKLKKLRDKYKNN